MSEHEKALVYVSLPVEHLTREQAEKLMAEVAGLLDHETQEPVFNRAAFDAPEDDPLRLWWHLSAAMLLLGKCDAVIFGPGCWFYPALTCPTEFDAAIRHGKTCLRTWRDADGKLHLLDMPHCGGPEKRAGEEEE